MKRKRIFRSAAAVLMACALTAPQVYAEEASMQQENVEAGFWLGLKSTNIPEVEAYTALKGALKFLSKGEEGKVEAQVSDGDKALLTGNLYVKDGTIYMTVPELTNKTFSVTLADVEKWLNDNAVLDTEVSGFGEDTTEAETDGEETEAPAESSETPNIDDIVEMFEGIDYTALLERYEKYCSDALSGLADSIETQDYGERDYSINGEYVTCQGTMITIPKDSAIDVADATVEFAFQDETCKDLLDQLTNGQLEDEDQIKEEIHNALEDSFGNIYFAEYTTPDGETAAWYLSMDQSDEMDYFLMSVENKGGEEIGENFDFQYSYSTDQTSINFFIEREAEHDGSITNVHVSSTMETGTQAPMEIQAIGGSDGPTSILVQDADETETDAVETEIAETETVETETVDETEFLGAEIETEDDFPDSYADYSVVGADWDSSYDSESGDYSVTFSMSQDGYDLFQVDADGNVGEKDGTWTLSCDSLKISSDDQYIELEGAVYGGDLVSELTFDGNLQTALNLMSASEEELTEVGTAMSQQLQLIIMQYMVDHQITVS